MSEKDNNPQDNKPLKDIFSEQLNKPAPTAKELNEDADFILVALIGTFQQSLAEYNKTNNTDITISLNEKSKYYRSKVSAQGKPYSISTAEVNITSNGKKIYSFDMAGFSTGNFYAHPPKLHYIDGHLQFNRTKRTLAADEKVGTTLSAMIKAIVMHANENQPKKKGNGPKP